MGNAIGYMRLIRSASMSYCAQMMQHLPNPDSLKIEKLDDDTIEKDVEYEPFNFGDITDALKMEGRCPILLFRYDSGNWKIT